MRFCIGHNLPYPQKWKSTQESRTQTNCNGKITKSNEQNILYFKNTRKKLNTGGMLSLW